MLNTVRARLTLQIINLTIPPFNVIINMSKGRKETNAIGYPRAMRGRVGALRDPLYYNTDRPADLVV